MNAIDRLIQAVERKQNPTVFGLDTRYEYLPKQSELGENYQQECAERIWEYNRTMLDALHEIVPAVKIQAAYYEMYGVFGMQVFDKSLHYAKELGYIVMSDVKRGDIGPTAQAYAQAHVGETQIDSHTFRAFPADFATVNPYLGTDGIKPFVQECEKHENGLFILVKTSNPSSGEFQDIDCDGKKLYELVAQKVEEWGADLVGESGYSSVGAVVGATYPEQGKLLRAQFQKMYFLVPGYGAQGATAKDLSGCFDKKGHGAIVNASRSLLCAYQKNPDLSLVDATRAEALRMKEDLLQAIGRIG